MKLSAYVRLRVGVNDQRGWWGENWLISVATVFRCYFFPCNTFITGRKKKKKKREKRVSSTQDQNSFISQAQKNFFLQQVFVRIDISISPFHTLKHAQIDIERDS